MTLKSAQERLNERMSNRKSRSKNFMAFMNPKPFNKIGKLTTYDPFLKVKHEAKTYIEKGIL